METFNQGKPYNTLPKLPPKANLETPSILKQSIKANKALAELKGIVETIPNQSILLNNLILLEAKDSSEVENIITTHDELYKSFTASRTTINPAIKEVLDYREALWHGYEAISKKDVITTNIIEEIQSVLAGNNAGIRKQTGTKLVNDKTGEVMYTPPEGEGVIRELLSNLEQYINEETDSVDPLIKMAVMHYQFESIHPFYDGNGRTGRILNVLYLCYKGLMGLPILFMSSYIIKRKAEYYTLLRSITKQDAWENWILYLLESVEQTSLSTISIVNGIRKLMETTGAEIKKAFPKMYSKELVEVLFSLPYCKISSIVDARIVERQSAATYLKNLEDKGILKGSKVGKEKLYLNTHLYELLKKQD